MRGDLENLSASTVKIEVERVVLEEDIVVDRERVRPWD